MFEYARHEGNDSLESLLRIRFKRRQVAVNGSGDLLVMSVRCSMRVDVTLVLASLVAATLSAAAVQQVPSPWVRCDVTTPNGIVGGSSERNAGSHGNTWLSVGPVAGLWPEGTVVFAPGGSGFITGDGALGMKFGWERGARGRLKVTGRRLDSEAPPLRSNVPCCYGENGETGFQASHLIFPTPGCWEVTAQVGEHEESKLTFVTRVVKIGDGPAAFVP